MIVKRSMNHLMAACCLALMGALGGCAANGTAVSSTTQSAEEALRSRVQARWDAVLALDFDRVYGFATPAYRQAHDLAHFRNQYASQIERTRIEIYETLFDAENENAAKVVVLLYFKAEGGAPGTYFEGMSRVVETWVRQDGQWWYVEPR